MNCKEKTTLKLSSNVIPNAMQNWIGLYIPVDLKPQNEIDKRLIDTLSPRQKKQLEKRLFVAKDIRDDEERYPEKKENFELCKDCEYKDICY